MIKDTAYDGTELQFWCKICVSELSTVCIEGTIGILDEKLCCLGELLYIVGGAQLRMRGRISPVDRLLGRDLLLRVLDIYDA